jgi:hypothetical protein
LKLTKKLWIAWDCQTQHVVVNQQPRSTMLLVSRLLGEKFVGTPVAERSITSAP